MAWRWPPPCSLVPNRHQNPEPARPGACPCSLDAPQLAPSHQDPPLWPHSSGTCRAPCCRTACGRAHTMTTPADTPPPETPPTGSGTPTPPLTPWRRARCSPAPQDAAPARPRAGLVSLVICTSTSLVHHTWLTRSCRSTCVSDLSMRRKSKSFFLSFSSKADD